MDCFASDLEWDIILINEKTLGVEQLDFSVTYLSDNRVKDKRNYQNNTISVITYLDDILVIVRKEVELDCKQRTHISSLDHETVRAGKRSLTQNPKENLKW